MDITIEGIEYTVNLEKAKEAGLIKKKTIKRRVRLGDVPIGSVFVWRSGFKGFGNSQFVLVSRDANGYIQSTYIDHDKLFQYSFGRSGLQFYNSSDIEGFYDQTGKFFSEIEESGAN